MSHPALVGCLILLAVMPAQAADCPLLRAIYEPVDEEAGKSYSLQHVVRDVGANQAAYVLRIREAKQAIAYDFSFAYANGYGGASLIFAGEPRKPRPKLRDGDPGSPILYFDARLSLAPTYADPAKPAPAYLLMSDLARAFWYWERGDRAFVPPAGIWKQTKCE